MFSFNNLFLTENISDFRKPSIPNKTSKKPIVILGCSYSYGTTLKDEETFGAQLSKYTNRAVYNFGLQSTGTASALYLLKNNVIKKQVQDADYFVYVFIYDHIRRNYLCAPNIVYNYFCANYYLDKNNNLKQQKLNKINMLFHSLYTMRLIENSYAEHKSKTNDMKLFDKILTEINKAIKKQYPNAKFIMLVYNDDPIYDEDNNLIIERDTNLDNICKREGIEIVYTQDLNCGKDILSRKHIAFDGWHPTKEAWHKIVPEFAQKTGM